jgi:hypothetical protein
MSNRSSLDGNATNMCWSKRPIIKVES